MNRDQINQSNMLQATHLILTTPANVPIYGGLAAFVRGQASLAGSINLLSALAQAQGSPLAGITVNKERLKLSLVSRAVVVAGAAAAYAFETGDTGLSAKFDYKEGVLKNMRDALLDQTCQNIHDDAADLVTALPAKLAEYNLTPQVLNDLQSALTAFGPALGTPRAAVANRVAITAAIGAELDRATDNLKNVLDRLMPQFTAAHPAFSAAYAAARKIIHTGHTKPAVPVPGTP